MQKPNLKGQGLAALFVLGCLLFNYPLLSLFNSSDSLWGIPALYAYLFVAWALFIGVAAIITEEVSFVTMLPKTRSGKIMRRVLKAQALGQDVGDMSTLEA